MVSELCNQYGMPLLVIAYPRREGANTDDNYYDLKANDTNDEDSLFDIVRDAVSAGSAGVSIGRNIFNRPNSAEIISRIKDIVFA